MNKKEIYLNLDRLERSEISKVYEFLKDKGENVSPYHGKRELEWSMFMNEWVDIQNSGKKEIFLSEFHKLFKRPILFAYFSDMNTLNEWINEDLIEIISLTYQNDRHIVYYKEKAF